MAEIIRLDKDDEAYLQKLSFPWQTKEQQEKDWMQELVTFLCNIFDQPFEQAVRCTRFGYAVMKKYKEARFAKLSALPVLRNLK